MREKNEQEKEARKGLDLERNVTMFSFKSKDKTTNYPKWHHRGRQSYNIRLLFKRSLIQNPKLPMIRAAVIANIWAYYKFLSER